MVTIKKTVTGKWVTFTIEPSNEISSVELKGEWNSWEPQLMKRKKNGEFSCRKKIKEGNWQFGYLFSDGQWITEQQCKTVTSPIGTQNSQLEIGA